MISLDERDNKSRFIIARDFEKGFIQKVKATS